MSLNIFSRPRPPKSFIVEPYTPKVVDMERPDHPCAQFRGDQVQKLYWQIGEIAEMLQIETSAIRYWLDYFGIEIKKDRAGHRQFTKDDVEKVKQIYYLLKVEMYTLEGTRRKLWEASLQPMQNGR